MHDAKGRELKVGDKVMIPAVITDIHASENYCNVNTRVTATMPGDKGSTPQVCAMNAINTRQLLRANDGDDLTFTVVQAAYGAVLIQ